jgi:gamma-glutamyltranspeptidase/glutathione hydrolase
MSPARRDPSLGRPWRALWLAVVLLLAVACALAGCAVAPDRAVTRSDTGTCGVGDGHAGVRVDPGLAGDASQPEPASGYRAGLKPVTARSFMVATAHPLATRAGCAVLAAGGSAADAAVAVQMVLGLVEPQSSGLGGGAFIVHLDAATLTVQTYDGRETAPAAATPDDLRWTGPHDPSPPRPDARASGRAIGTPGVLRALELLHADHGRHSWAGLFEPGIRHADQGFEVGGRLADAIRVARDRLRLDADAAAYFLHPDGRPRARGAWLRNPAYADTLRAIAAGGADAFYEGDIAADIVTEIGRRDAGTGAPDAFTPGRTTLADLAAYRAVRRAPVCTDYRAYRVCGMGPPSSGGIALAQALGMLSHFDLSSLRPQGIDGDGGRPDAQAVHLVSEALRLAFADRNRFVADTDFVALPGSGAASMLDAEYLRQRAGVIRLDASLGTAPAGRFDGAAAMGSSAHEGHGTSHVSIVDAQGNAVSMTTTIESSLGAYRFVRGFVLNNQLTDFASAPADAEGPVANRLEAGKRPRSSMAPTLVFRRAADGSTGPLLMVTGSPGGAAIIPYVLKTLLAVLDWGLDAQQAASLVNFGAFNGPTTFLGGEHPAIAAADAAADPAADAGRAEPLAAALRALGHRVALNAQPSGVATILRVDGPGLARWQGGVDPRREGLALGD